MQATLLRQVPDPWRWLSSRAMTPELLTMMEEQLQAALPSAFRQVLPAFSWPGACPYALHCGNGMIVKTDHGNLTARPPARFASMDLLVRNLGISCE
jgi:hypothetical protein